VVPSLLLIVKLQQVILICRTVGRNSAEFTGLGSQCDAIAGGIFGPTMTAVGAPVTFIGGKGDINSNVIVNVHVALTSQRPAKRVILHVGIESGNHEDSYDHDIPEYPNNLHHILTILLF
jgi:hypothetical protein